VRFFVEFLTKKKKVIFFVLRAKVKKKLRNWKKVPFYQFPHKAWGEGYYETPCMKAMA
jgi:hypothetical protein